MNLLAEPPANGGAVDQVLAAVRAAFAAESRSQGLQVPEPILDLSAVEPEAFLHAVKVQHVEQIVASHARSVGLPEGVAAGVQDLASAEAAGAFTLAAQTARACRLLQEAGIPAIAFKGVALSLQTTGSLTARGSGDIDLLVEAANVVAAMSVLRVGGWQPWQPLEVTAAWWPYLSPLIRELPLTGERSSVDLHWRIASEPRFLSPTRDMLARADTIDMLGQPVMVLGADDALVAACYAFQLDRFASLRLALDVARLVRERTTPLRLPHRRHAMATEAISAAVYLTGGIPPAHLDRLGVPAPGLSRRAAAGWRRGRRHPYLSEVRPWPILTAGTVLRKRRYEAHLLSLYRAALSRTLARDDLRPTGAPSWLGLYAATARSLPSALRRRPGA